MGVLILQSSSIISNRRLLIIILVRAPKLEVISEPPADRGIDTSHFASRRYASEEDAASAGLSGRNVM